MIGAIAQHRRNCESLFVLMKNPRFYRAARAESERRRQPAVASSFDYSYGDRVDKLGHAAERGSVAQMAEDLGMRDGVRPE